MVKPSPACHTKCVSISCSNAYSDLNTFLSGQKCSIVCSAPNMTSEVIHEAMDQISGYCDNVAGRIRNIEKIINQTCATVTHTDCFFQIPSDDVFNVIKSSFDNAATPIFGLIICLWAHRRQLKAVLSFSVGIIMVGCVFISVLAVIIYKTWARFRVTTRNSFESFLLTTIVSSLLNALSISILGKVYHIIAVKMTDWENYRTQTDYNDALIIKLFAFEFANNYSSLFYIAFLRTNNEQFFTSIGLPGLEDNCGELNNCMTELCFQVLTLMITKPLPKFINDVIAPYAAKRSLFEPKTHVQAVSAMIRFNVDKLLLFAVSFPLGPLIFFLTIFFDIHVDAKRLLWMYKRPIAHMAQDIGHWFTILDLINNIAVVTNGCLIAFTADFGKEKPFHEKLIILIVFEHAVFLFKYLLSVLIPDVPQHIQQAIRRHTRKWMLNSPVHYRQSAISISKGRDRKGVRLFIYVAITEQMSDLH
ncbi:hypothetical protein scyTo_0015837 [Scyliorhinus torazame]|uniref:Anoctamin n=1 Tax=Scyliorhinus torazame TaxID=75743 RepID=A0A401PZ92_SCYTO|nr:hypothetical protein [Scyliorhinus torazame]